MQSRKNRSDVPRTSADARKDKAPVSEIARNMPENGF